jgi:PERQ amino acid-rich with GYF domain-containing protein
MFMTEVLYTGRPNSSMGQSLRDLENDHADFQLTPHDPHSVVGEANLPQHNVPRDSDLSPLGLLWSELEGHPKQPLSSNVLGVNERRNSKPTTPKDILPVNMRQGPLSRMNEVSSVRDEWPANFGRLDNMNGPNISGRIPQVEAEHHLNFDGHLLLQQIRREQQQHQQRQEQLMARSNLEFSGAFPGQVFDSLHQHRQPMNQQLPDVEHLLRVQFELEQQQQHQLQQEQHQRQLQQQRQAQFLQRQQQQQQQQMILEQLLQQQLQGSNFGPTNMVDQVLLREHVFNELHQQPHHLQRQHDAAIEQLIQAKFGHGLHREHHNDMLDVLSRSNQRQMLPLEQQILLGLQHEHEQQLQSQQLANALRQHSGREEEMHLSGVWPMDDAAQFIRSGTSPNQRHGCFDLLENLQRSSSFDHHDHLDRSLSLQERLHMGGLGIHSLERSDSLPGGGPGPNTDVINALSRHHGLGQLETHGDVYPLGQMPMLPSGVHPQQHRHQEQLPGSHIGRRERHWSDANGQLQNSLMQSSHINQLQMEVEKQRRNVEMNLSVDNPHAWAALMNKERNAEQDLSDMIHKKLALQSQQSLGFPDVSVAASFGHKDHFVQPVAENPLRSVDMLSFEESLSERSLYAKSGQLAQEGSANLGTLPNSIENTGNFNLRPGSGSMFEQKHFLGIDDVQSDFSETTGGRTSANQLVGSVNELTRGKRQGSSASLAGDDTNFSEEAVSKWYSSKLVDVLLHYLLSFSKGYSLILLIPPNYRSNIFLRVTQSVYSDDLTLGHWIILICTLILESFLCS